MKLVYNYGESNTLSSSQAPVLRTKPTIVLWVRPKSAIFLPFHISNTISGKPLSMVPVSVLLMLNAVHFTYPQENIVKMRRAKSILNVEKFSYL